MKTKSGLIMLGILWSIIITTLMSSIIYQGYREKSPPSIETDCQIVSLAVEAVNRPQIVSLHIKCGEGRQVYIAPDDVRDHPRLWAMTSEEMGALTLRTKLRCLSQVITTPKLFGLYTHKIKEYVGCEVAS